MTDYLIALLLDPNAWAALSVLIVMEVVLGIDNLIFISILTNKLPEENRESARRIGISAALVLRLVLLGTIAYIIRLTAPLFELFGRAFSWRDLILIAGGLFLVWKATKEIHHNVDPDPNPDIFDGRKASIGVAAAIGQILLLDLVFSLDSIITAVGMTEHVPIMVVAVVVTVVLMLIAATPLANFINDNPTIVMLALAVTSNDASVRWLRRRWQRLHRLVYIAAILTFAHWVLSAFEPVPGWIHLGVLAALEVYRLLRSRRRRPEFGL